MYKYKHTLTYTHAERERERERDRERQRETERETETERQRQRDRGERGTRARARTHIDRKTDRWTGGRMNGWSESGQANDMTSLKQRSKTQERTADRWANGGVYGVVAPCEATAVECRLCRRGRHR